MLENPKIEVLLTSAKLIREVRDPSCNMDVPVS